MTTASIELFTHIGRHHDSHIPWWTALLGGVRAARRASSTVRAPRPGRPLPGPGPAGHRAHPGGRRPLPAHPAGGRPSADLGPGRRVPGPRHRAAPRRRRPSTTSPCGRTSSGSSTGTAWSPTPSTAGSASSPPTPSGPATSASRSGARSGASPTATAGSTAVMGAGEDWLPDLPRLGDARHLPRRRGGGAGPGVHPGRRAHEGPAPGPQPDHQVRLHGHLPRPGPPRPGARPRSSPP